MKSVVNWAILAPGTIAASMARAMKETAANDSRIRLYAIASRDKTRADSFAQKWGFEKAYGSYADLVADTAVDAVYIANPHSFHLQSALECIQNGKHVLCEKPAGCNAAQLERMIGAAKTQNVFFMEAMWTAFNPCIKRVREAVTRGAIGNLKHIESRFCNRIPYDERSRMWAPDLAGGALLDLGIYNIYVSSIINGFCPIAGTADGETVAAVTGTENGVHGADTDLHCRAVHNSAHGGFDTAEACENCANYIEEKCTKNKDARTFGLSSIVRMYKNVDAWESVNIVYRNGVTASFQSSCDMCSESGTHDAVVFGTKGFITIKNFFYAEEAVVHTYNAESGSESTITDVIREPFAVNGYEYELIHATDCIVNGKTESNVHTFDKSRTLIATMDALRRSWGFTYPFE